VAGTKTLGTTTSAPIDPREAHPLVVAAEQLAAEVLAPRAEAVDQSALLPRSHLDALAAAGLMGLVGPLDAGGQAAPGPVARRVQRVIAGACGATFFTWVQHHAPVRHLTTAPDNVARRKWLAPLCSGDVRGGVAFAYLRRPGPPAVRAVGDRAGAWALEGTAPWVTGWGLVDVVLVVAAAADGRKVLALVPTDDRRLVAEPLDLMVLGATGTTRLSFDGVCVPSELVVDIWSAERWEAVDTLAAAQPVAAPFGIAQTCVDGLLRTDGPHGPAAIAAEALADELARCTIAVEQLLSGSPSNTSARSKEDLVVWTGRLTAARDWSIDLACRASQAWIAAARGGSMSRAHPAQRLAREAAFYLVQAQTAALRETELTRLSRPADQPRLAWDRAGGAPNGRPRETPPRMPSGRARE